MTLTIGAEIALFISHLTRRLPPSHEAGGSRGRGCGCGPPAPSFTPSTGPGTRGVRARWTPGLETPGVTNTPCNVSPRGGKGALCAFGGLDYSLL